MVNLVIFGFGLAVTLMVGFALATMIVHKNKGKVEHDPPEIRKTAPSNAD